MPPVLAVVVTVEMVVLGNTSIRFGEAGGSSVAMTSDARLVALIYGLDASAVRSKSDQTWWPASTSLQSQLYILVSLLTLRLSLLSLPALQLCGLFAGPRSASRHGSREICRDSGLQ